MAITTIHLAWVERVLEIPPDRVGKQFDGLAKPEPIALATPATKPGPLKSFEEPPELSPGAEALAGGGSPPGKGGGQPPDRTPPDKVAETPAPVRKNQTVVWHPPGLIFGAALNVLPAAVVVEGNVGAQIDYEPALDGTIPPVGTMTIFVSVPGNAAFNPVVRAPFPLTVGPRPLVVTVQPAEMAAGQAPPALQHTAVSLAPGDTITVAFTGAPAANAAPKMDGYPVAPVVTFTHGAAANYDITLVSGHVVVTPSFNDMDATITRIRHGILGLPDRDKDKAAEKATLLARLDDVEAKRNQRATAPAALETLLREIDRALYEAAYVAVSDVKVALVAGAPKIARDETLKLQATVEPANATEQGVTWATDNPELVAVSPTGDVSRPPGSVAGGKAVVRATARSRELLTGALTIDVTPKPTSIEIEAPEHVFFNSAVTLKARVEPPDAPHDVTWTIQGSRKPQFVTLNSGTGELTIDRPAAHQKIAGGKLTILAKSTVVTDVTQPVEIEFGGFAASNVSISLPRNAKFGVGDAVPVTARVSPGEASQNVTWSLSDGDVATLGEPGQGDGGSTVSVTLNKLGQVELTATATDGTGVFTSRWLGASAPLVSISINCPKLAIQLTESVILTPVFTPPEAKCPVTWTSSDTSVLTVDKTGKVQPGKVGSATITATAEGKTNKVAITVALVDAAVLTADQSGPMLALIDTFAAKIGIDTKDDKTYQSYRYKLVQDVAAGGRTPVGAGGAARVPIALTTVRADLIEIRNKRYTKEHADWLADAGFNTGSGNCRTRECGAAVLASMRFNEAHLTLYDTKAQLPIGASFPALVNAVLRATLPQMQGLHLTAYGPSKAEEMKVYNSGAPWTPKFEILAEWAKRWDPAWTQAWQDDPDETFNNYQFIDRVRNELKTWFDGQIPARRAALQIVYDAVKQYDTASFA